MKPARPRPWRLVPLMAATTVVLAACGGGGDDGLPRLAAARASNLSGSCADLQARLNLANTTITSVSTVAAGTLTVGGQPVREHCLVRASSHARTGIDNNAYAIGWEMRLPTNWNGRFLHQGNGGIDGAVVPATGTTGGGALTHALHQGFAVLSSDAGHPGNLGPNFGIDPQARLDYGYQAVQKMTPIAKSLITSAYTRGPDRSYFAGCSNGGRHAMIAATRFAADYDGILAGAPGYNLPKAAAANMGGAQLYNSVATTPGNLATGFTQDERNTVSAAIRTRCDALDGATDGIVQDVQACRTAFDLARDVPTCTGARNGSCLTTAQKTAISKIFSGPTTSNGSLVYATFPYDPGISQPGNAFWEFTAPLALDSGAIGLIFGTPPEATTFNGPAYALNTSMDTFVARINATNATYTESGMSFATPPNPSNMRNLRERGGKIIVYHGVSDPIFSVDDSETWYKGLLAGTGADRDFARFYRVPGMGHCSGGPSTDQFDLLTKLTEWVEQGQAPEAVVAAARSTGNAGGANPDVVAAGWAANRTRPLCPYPQVARYNGTGDVESAASFTCR